MAQILRKSGADLGGCIDVLLKNAANDPGLVQLAGMIIVQVTVSYANPTFRFVLGFKTQRFSQATLQDLFSKCWVESYSKGLQK